MSRDRQNLHEAARRGDRWAVLARRVIATAGCEVAAYTGVHTQFRPHQLTAARSVAICAREHGEAATIAALMALRQAGERDRRQKGFRGTYLNRTFIRAMAALIADHGDWPEGWLARGLGTIALDDFLELAGTGGRVPSAERIEVMYAELVAHFEPIARRLAA